MFRGARDERGTDDNNFWAAARGRHGRHRGGPFHGGPPPGPGGWGPGGPPGAPPWAQWFGRGHRARRGDVRGAILLVLADKPLNGYQIMQELAQRTGGTWRPSSGSVYPTLQQLEDEGLVDDAGKAEQGATGRVFKLTERGKTYVGKHRDELETAWPETPDAGDDPRAELMHLGAALGQIMRAGTPAQITEARKLLVELRRKLYGLLASDASDDAVDDE